MAKFKVTSPISHDGKEYGVGEFVELTDGKEIAALKNAGAIATGKDAGGKGEGAGEGGEGGDAGAGDDAGSGEGKKQGK